MRETLCAIGMRKSLVLALGAAAVLGLPAPAESGGSAARERGSRTVRARLTPSVDAGGRLRGRIVARRNRRNPARDVLALELSGMHRGTEYTLAFDDPATPDRRAKPVVAVRGGRGRKARTVMTGSGPSPLPYGASLDQLEGTTVEVRDSDGVVLLTGTVPAADGSTAQATDVECRFLETVDLEDLFDTATAGAAPPDWTVTGTDVAGIEVVVDDTVFDGASGASVRLGDTVAADPGAPSMSRTFTAQDLFFAVEFTLLTNDTPTSLTVMQVSDSTTTPPTVPTGLGAGLGFHEDGSIGFGSGDSFGTQAANTAYHFRVDFDFETQTFDVSLDGTQVVADRDLGFTGTTLDTISFSGSAATTGTAFVDTVRVIHLERDCAPTANAGPDQTLECAGTTSVVLDGSASADPEGAELTYTWTGNFVGGTAEGATPTVEFTEHGTQVVTLVVNDGFFDSIPDEVTIEIADTTPPELSVTGLPNRLWPPNHKLHTIAPTVSVSDVCDGAESVTLTLTITSNEADDGIGDGSTTGDWVVRSASDFDVRAERSGPGSGRIYTLVWTATDSSGNSTTTEGHILVPHDNGHGGGRGRGPK